MNKETEKYAHDLLQCKIRLASIPEDLKPEVINIVNNILLTLPAFVTRQIVLQMVRRHIIDELSIDDNHQFLVL